MAGPADSAFTAPAQQQAVADAKTVGAPAPEGVNVTAEAQGSYKLVKSPTGNNLYVEAREYDPLEHHRKKDKASSKGEGLGFMFCCFGSKANAPPQEPERHYEIKPSPSMDNIPDKGL